MKKVGKIIAMYPREVWDIFRDPFYAERFMPYTALYMCAVFLASLGHAVYAHGQVLSLDAGIKLALRHTTFIVVATPIAWFALVAVMVAAAIAVFGVIQVGLRLAGDKETDFFAPM